MANENKKKNEENRRSHITFAQPDFAALTKKYFCVDMHLHSNHSDGFNHVNYILNRAKKLGIALALSDHNTIFGNLAALRQKRVPIIPSMEVNSRDGPHILFYFYHEKEYIEFYTKHIKKYVLADPNAAINKSLAELYDDSKAYNCIASLAHPNGLLWANINNCIINNKENRRVLNDIPALEVINGVQLRKSNVAASKLAIDLDKAFTGGSDAHFAMEMGSVVTYAHAQNTHEFLDALRKKQTRVIGQESPVPKRIISNGHILYKHLLSLKDVLRERLKNRF